MIDVFDLDFHWLLSHSLKIPLTLPATCGMWGKDEYNNFQLLHRHCHDNITVQDAVGTKELNVEWLDANPF
jgi:hypothetical protein